MEEVVLVIAGIVVAVWLVRAYVTNKNVARYRNALQAVVESMDNSNYKDTPIYKVRMEALEQQGWTETSFNLLNDLRTFMIQEYSVSQSFFSRPDVYNIEYLFIMKYAVVHEYTEEFQHEMVMGKFATELLGREKK